MTDDIYCLDSGMLIKVLASEEPLHLLEAATDIVSRAFTEARVVMPSFGWTEIGSVLRKKVRQNIITQDQAEDIWTAFTRMPIEFIETPALHIRAWEIATRHNLATLYDAAYLACTELAPGPAGITRQFWTADQSLVRSLGADVPGYVRLIGARTQPSG